MLPTHGTLLFNSTSVNVGVVFNEKDLKAGLIQYQHDDTETTADYFLYVVHVIQEAVRKQFENSSQLMKNTFELEIQPVNDQRFVLQTGKLLYATHLRANL